jgi:hypothetical protein
MRFFDVGGKFQYRSKCIANANEDSVLVTDLPAQVDSFVVRQAGKDE